MARLLAKMGAGRVSRCCGPSCIRAATCVSRTQLFHASGESPRDEYQVAVGICRLQLSVSGLRLNDRLIHAPAVRPAEMGVQGRAHLADLAGGNSRRARRRRARANTAARCAPLLGLVTGCDHEPASWRTVSRSNKTAALQSVGRGTEFNAARRHRLSMLRMTWVV